MDQVQPTFLLMPTLDPLLVPMSGVAGQLPCLKPDASDKGEAGDALLGGAAEVADGSSFSIRLSSTVLPKAQRTKQNNNKTYAISMGIYNLWTSFSS